MLLQHPSWVTTNSIPLRFFTNNAERMRIDAANGRLGIGTINPQQRFHVEGPTLLSIFVSTSPLSNISGAGMIGYTKFLPTAAGHRLGYFLLGSRGGAESNLNAAGMVGYADGAWTAGSSHPAYLAFETTPSGSATRVERLKIGSNGDINFNNGQLFLQQSTGKIGIGTDLPTAVIDLSKASYEPLISLNNIRKASFHYVALTARSVNGPGFGYGVNGTGGYRGVTGMGDGGASYNQSIGVMGYGYGQVGYGTRMGLYGVAVGGQVAYGVYATASGASGTNAAGVFDGDVYATNYFTTSDRKFKKDIEPINDALERVMKLSASRYFFKIEEYKGMYLPKGKQIGLIADEVKKIFPELVQKAVQPAKYDEKDESKIISPSVEYEAVNYQGLIPVLIASVQEQQKQIVAQQSQIEQQQKENSELRKELTELKAMVAKLAQGTNAVSLTNAALGATNPNPAKGVVSIRYSLPQGSTSAYLIVADMKGSTIKRININSIGAGQVQLNTASLAAGTYTYSLFVDGAKVDSKQLLIAR